MFRRKAQESVSVILWLGRIFGVRHKNTINKTDKFNYIKIHNNFHLSKDIIKVPKHAKNWKKIFLNTH